MKIEVTQEDIDEGRPKNSWNCPVALALFRATNWKWGVDERNAYIIALPRLKQLPFSARHFVMRFDARKPVKPFAFTLDCESTIARAEEWQRLRKESKAANSSDSKDKAE